MASDTPGQRYHEFSRTPAACEDFGIPLYRGLRASRLPPATFPAPLCGASSFDLVVHPCSNCFVPDAHAVWREVFRVLAPGGTLLSGCINPAVYVFDDAASNRGELLVRHRLPYSDQESLTETEQRQLIDAGEPFVFSHSLEGLIGGQTDAGFVITDLYEDSWPEKPISRFMPSFIATRVQKPS